MKVAVVYASKHGSTRQIAERIAAVLRVEGQEADAFLRRERGRPRRLRRRRAGQRRLHGALAPRGLALSCAGTVCSSAPCRCGCSPAATRRRGRRPREDPAAAARAPHRRAPQRARPRRLRRTRAEGPDVGFIARSIAESCAPEQRDARDWTRSRPGRAESPPSSRRPPRSDRTLGTTPRKKRRRVRRPSVRRVLGRLPRARPQPREHGIPDLRRHPDLHRLASIGGGHFAPATTRRLGLQHDRPRRHRAALPPAAADAPPSARSTRAGGSTGTSSCCASPTAWASTSR